MTGVVMIFYVLHVNGIANPRLLIKISHIARQIRVVHNAFQVAFEVININRIKTHQSGKKTPIRLSYGAPR